MQCLDGSASVSVAIGIMSESSHVRIRNAIRQTWFQSLNSFPHISACFLFGMYIKRTPRASWDSRKKKSARQVDGVLIPNPWISDLRLEQRKHRDSVILTDSAEIDCFGSGTSGLKTLPWWKYSVEKFPNARWVAKTDDDIYVDIPSVAPMIEKLRVSDRMLFGTIRRDICYSPVRYQFEFINSGTCPSSSFSRTFYPGDESDPAATYEGLFPFALGWFYAVSAPVARSLARCEYAHEFHHIALNRRAGHFMRRGDDPMNGFLMHKCIANRTLHTISMDPLAIHNLGCYSKKGLYRIVNRNSKIVHAVKSAKAMGFVHKTMLSTDRTLFNATKCAAARSARRSE